MKLLKCCIQYVSKFGRLSSGHRTGKYQFSLQFQRRAMPKNVQTNHTVTLISNAAMFVKVGFSSMWTENFQMYRLHFEKAEKPEINLPTFTGSWRKQGSSRKISISTSLTTWKLLTVCITRNWKILKEMGIPDRTNLYSSQESTVRTRHGTMTGWKLGKEYNKAMYCHPVCLTYMESTLCEMPGWWIRSWNQDY